MKDVEMSNVCPGQWYKYPWILRDKLIIRKQHITMVETTQLLYLKECNLG